VDRPRSATVVPVLFLAGALGAAVTFDSGQRSEGTPALHAAAKELEKTIEGRLTGAKAQLTSVEVRGDEGRTTFQIALPGTRPGTHRVGEQAFRWRRGADGSWRDPEGVGAPRAAPTGRGGR